MIKLNKSETYKQINKNELEIAWGIIANASGGDWDKESEMWRKAAIEFGERNGFRAKKIKTGIID